MLKLDCPRDSDIHTLADFIELLCLVRTDRFCSRDDVVDYVTDQFVDSGKDKRIGEGELDDAFMQITWRIGAFGDQYPFSLVEHGRIISAHEELTVQQNLYAFLLLCANLPFVNERRERNELTDAFERASMQALRRLWPAKATIRKFGRGQTEYAGTKWERLNALSRDIGGKAMLSEKTFRARDSGDGGIDLVAWLNLDDYEKLNIPSALGQCACSREDWSSKQYEISVGRLGSHLFPTHPWMQLIFIPHSFRDNAGIWAVPGDIAQCIVMDRLRILNYLCADTDWPEIQVPAVFGKLKFLQERLDLV